ncbi:hypothetical protein STEG23_008450 [Scotinomys teguina]
MVKDGQGNPQEELMTSDSLKSPTEFPCCGKGEQQDSATIKMLHHRTVLLLKDHAHRSKQASSAYSLYGVVIIKERPPLGRRKKETGAIFKVRHSLSSLQFPLFVLTTAQVKATRPQPPRSSAFIYKRSVLLYADPTVSREIYPASPPAHHSSGFLPLSTRSPYGPPAAPRQDPDQQEQDTTPESFCGN